MSITADNIAFFASQTMADTPDGGGPRSAVQLQNGSPAGSIFPAVSAADRSTGRVRLRKIYPSATNANTSALLGASVAINEVPADAAVSVAMFAAAGAVQARTSALDFLRAAGGQIVSSQNFVVAISGSNLVTGLDSSRWSIVDSYLNTKWCVISGQDNFVQRRSLRRVLSRSGGTLTLDEAVPFTASVDLLFFQIFPHESNRVYGAAPVAGAVASGAVSFFLHRPVKVIGLSDGASYAHSYTLEGYGLIFESGIGNANGYGTPVRQGDICTLWHEAATAPANQANGSTVNVGRTDLDQLAVVNSAGVEVVRFLRGGPATGANITANLATGVVTFVNVTGLAQPLTVRHRIAHRSAAGPVDQAFVTLANPVPRDFPAGSILSTHLPLGDIQARALNAFGQQAWTRVWSDTIIGNPAPLPYTGAITVTNQGAETDRYALVMTGPTAFTAYSERFGLLGTGSTTATYAPLNPATGAALFTLAPAGWAAQQLVGSVLRFNTEGAAPPVWVVQSIAPSSPTGSTSTAVRLFGSV